MYFEDLEIIQTQNRRPNNRKPHRKVTKVKSKFSLILGQLNPGPGTPLLDLAKPIYTVHCINNNLSVIFCSSLVRFKKL